MSKEGRQYPHIKVLYIEDDSFTREKLLRILNRRFHHIFVASNAECGYQFYKKYAPDIIITDLKMTQVNGLEMIRKIREQNDKVQVIVTTGHDENDIFIQSIEYNVNHFILKPIELDKLLLAIQKSVHQIQLETELEVQKSLTRAILDSQDSVIFTIENDIIVDFNEAFSIITGVQKNQPLSDDFMLSHFFVNDPEYFYPNNKENWVKEFQTKGRTFAKVKWCDAHGVNRIYFMKSSPILNNKQLLFVCTDITELEAEFKKNKFLSNMDLLTTTFTRQKFNELLSNEVEKGYPFSIILFDLDYFANVNENFDNHEGDLVLCTLSTMVQQCISEEDQLARWDGDKFILLIPNKNAQEGKRLAETIRTLIDEFQFQKVGHLTCSFGITEFKIGNTIKEVLKEAEHALAHSKHTGRNRCTIYQS